jgi:hypothetical protein
VIAGTPEHQARRDIERCTEIAHIMMTPQTFESQMLTQFSKPKITVFGDPAVDVYKHLPLAQGYKDALYGWTLTCVLGKR